MYEALLGQRFKRLSEPVQTFHRLSGQHVLHGWVQTEAPATMLARLMALCLGSPLSHTDGPIRFELNSRPTDEVWTRHFPTKTMKSHLRLQHGKLAEHLGLTTLYFDLDESDGRLIMRLKRLRFLGIPCPAWAMPNVLAEEDGQGDRLQFNVRASLPFVGQVAGYRGYLVLDAKEAL